MRYAGRFGGRRNWVSVGISRASWKGETGDGNGRASRTDSIRDICKLHVTRSFVPLGCERNQATLVCICQS